ncbi:MAG: WXG100 family type VII secretion target [Actinomycetaceae bacterium]|nr:WXG100 family type VII secretion target [Actinomycetaceae bacterium]
MAFFSVDAQQVHEASAHTSALATRLREEVAAMMAQLHTLESAWSGQASQAFAGCAQRWAGAQSHVESALDEISRALAAASATYEEAEAQATSLFAR